MTRGETGGRQKLIPRIDRIAGLSVAIFGETSLYFGQYPAVSPSPDPTPTPEPSGTLAPCAADE
jgi:hypothetical protein